MAPRHLLGVLVVFLLPAPTPAPVPRCSPLIFINKLAEFSNIWSDSNPYFPVPPCEYGGPLEALANGDKRAVFVTNQPLKIPLHNFYEFIWLLKTGLPRMVRILAGKEPFVYDANILKEKYQHYTPYVRSGQLGHGTQRRPEIIDDFGIYRSVVGSKIRSLVREGPDRRPSAFTPVGPLRRDGPATQGPSPAYRGTPAPAYSGQGPAYSGQGPAYSGQGPAYSGQGPAYSGQGPAPVYRRQATYSIQDRPHSLGSLAALSYGLRNH